MINNVVIMGRLTYEPELRTTPQGTSVVRFSVACERKYSREETDFIDCIAWRKTAEFISQYFHKGDMIALTGCITANNYTDKQGNRRKSVEVTADAVSFCGSKAERTDSVQRYTQPAPTYAAADNSDFEEIVDDDDDLPF